MCPEGYPQQDVLYTDVDDSRACSPCGCTDPVGLCDSAFVRVYSVFVCNPPQAASVSANGECANGTGNTGTGAILTPEEPTAFCSPVGGAPGGEAIGAMPLTVCCQDAAG